MKTNRKYSTEFCLNLYKLQNQCPINIYNNRLGNNNILPNRSGKKLSGGVPTQTIGTHYVTITRYQQGNVHTHRINKINK